MHLLFSAVFSFLKKRLEPNATLLLAYSGGPDSTALLYLLLEIQKKIPFELELAHVDHQQRFESTKEAHMLQKLAKSLGLKFHLCTIDEPVSGNLEDFFRSKRYAFFSKLYQKKNYQALLLGHQKDDLEETVLKRFFEGAHFDHLQGMQKVKVLNQMTLWRPFLETSKEEIVAWLRKKGLSFIEDSTNLDPQFLRARLRGSLIPFIEKSFGKKIRPNLVKYSKSSVLLDEYLAIQTRKFVPKKNKWSGFLDFSDKNYHLLEIEYIIRKYVPVTFSQKHLDDLLKVLIEKKANKSFETKEFLLIVDRERLFYFKTPFGDLPEESLLLKMGSQTFGSWLIEVEEGKKELSSSLGFERLFEKEPRFFIQIPMGSYTLQKPQMQNELIDSGKKLSKWFANHKIPRPICLFFPVIQQDNKVVRELLTAKVFFSKAQNFLNIYFTYEKH